MKHKIDWKDICLVAKKNIRQDIEAGNLNLALKKIRSVLTIETNSSIYRDDDEFVSSARRHKSRD